MFVHNIYVRRRIVYNTSVVQKLQWYGESKTKESSRKVSVNIIGDSAEF